MVRAFKIKVPASSANIGPGYDVLGVGLSLFLELDVTIDSSQAQETNDDPNNCKLSYTKESEGYSTVPLRSDANLITRTALYVLRCNNIRNFPSGTKVHVSNPIPLGRGLGSSGAAVVAGVILGNEVAQLGFSKQRMLDYCLMIERHPDNITAAMMGGFCGSFLRDLTPQEVERREIPLAEAPPLNDLVFNLQRLAVLTTALTMDPPNADLIYPAMQDRVHQPYRKTLIPGLTEILSCVTPSTYPGLLGICLSGAGPTILALATENFEEISQEIINRFAKNGIKCSWKLLEPAYDGASVEQQ
ncbi:homoserine kinase [Saccharomyces cerevisiae]|nr:homoserine kinase [Saccharomyces cerevisiae]